MGAGYSQSDTVQRRDREMMRLIGLRLQAKRFQSTESSSPSHLVQSNVAQCTSSRCTGYAETLRGLGLYQGVTEGSRLYRPDAFVLSLSNVQPPFQPCAIHVLYSAHSTTVALEASSASEKAMCWHMAFASLQRDLGNPTPRHAIKFVEGCRLG